MTMTPRTLHLLLVTLTAACAGIGMDAAAQENIRLAAQSVVVMALLVAVMVAHSRRHPAAQPDQR